MANISRMADIAALEEDIAYLEAHPEHHDQRTFYGMPGMNEYDEHLPPSKDPQEILGSCGTTYCLAGYKALKVAKEHGWRMRPDWGFEDANGIHRGFAGEVARDSYSLSGDQSHALFYCAVTLEDLKGVVKAIANGEAPTNGLKDPHA